MKKSTTIRSQHTYKFLLRHEGLVEGIGDVDFPQDLLRVRIIVDTLQMPIHHYDLSRFV
jgi:hypothetical protein